MKAPKWATGAAIVVVLGAWAGTLVVDMINPAYDPPTGIEPLMMALAAFLFAAQAKDDKPKPEPVPETPKVEETSVERE